MKVVVACDKYKGNIGAMEICNIIKSAILDTDGEIEVVLRPMADGGEGTVETMVESRQGRYITVPVKGPLGEEIQARFGIIDKHTAVIEMASASGIALIDKDRLNPMETTTYGTGQLIKEALEAGCRKIIIGIGGSATTDGGMGMAQALGIKFYSPRGEELGWGGKQLKNIEKIDMNGLHPQVSKVKIEVACDVDNPLTGKNGAAYVYSPQKGADDKMVQELDEGLQNFAAVVKRDLNIDVGRMKGAGAAGGLGAGLAAFLGASLKPGTDIITEAIGLREAIEGSNLVITGEGAMDRQTFYGKSAYGVARVADDYKVPVATINGSVLVSREEVDPDHARLFSGNFSTVNKPLTLEQAIAQGRKLAYDTAREIINFYLSIYYKMKP